MSDDKKTVMLEVPLELAQELAELYSKHETPGLTPLINIARETMWEYWNEPSKDEKIASNPDELIPVMLRRAVVEHCKEHNPNGWAVEIEAACKRALRPKPPCAYAMAAIATLSESEDFTHNNICKAAYDWIELAIAELGDGEL